MSIDLMQKKSLNLKNSCKVVSQQHLAGRSAFALLVMFLSASLMALSGCGSGGYPGDGIKSLSASSAIIDGGQSFSVTASMSGAANVTWSLTGPACSGESCGTVSSGEGTSTVYTAPTNVTTALQVTLTAAVAGTQNSFSVAITVNPDPVLSGNLAAGTVGTAYNATITATGGTTPLKAVTITNGSLPGGLTFNATTGAITGTPTAAGSFSFTVQVTDSSSIPFTASALETITISTPVTPLTVVGGAPPAGTVGTAYTTSLTAIGGTTPYTWSIVSGALPAGLSLSPTTGIISGTPTTVGISIFTAQAQDATGTRATAVFSIPVNAAATPLTISVSTLPGGTVGVPYNATIPVTGGTAPYACSEVSGTLPAGLTLTGCVVSGTPTAAGTSTFQAKATDSSNPVQTANSPETITIVAATTPLSIALSTLPNGTVGVAYSATIPVTGGTAPYSCTMTGGTLPGGLTLTGCVLSGTPTTANTFSFQVKATDTSNPVQTATGTETVTIAPAPIPLTITLATLPNGTVGVAYSATIPITGGTAPYACTMTGGTLPGGLTLTGCVLSGTPTTANTFSFQVKVTDASNPVQTTSGTETVTITAAPIPLSLTVTSLPNGTVNVPYTSTIGVTGGTAPYSCTITAGTLPAGLTLTSAGCIVSGTPTTAGTVALTVKATDSSTTPQTTSGPVSLTINPAITPLTITVTTLPNGTVNIPYTATIGVTGGTAPYSCTITAGTLPAGLTLTSAGCIVSGTPTTAGTVALTVKATDSSTTPQTTSGPVSLTINPAGTPLTITVSTLPNGTVSVPYSQTIGVSGGTAPYSCIITNGTLPAGLTLTSVGCIVSGTPTTAGTVDLTVKATDSSNPVQTTTAPVSLTINPAPVLVISSPPIATVGTPYSGIIPVSGGTGPYSCTLTSGTLPAGLTLTSAGCVISGTPTTAGPVTVTVKVTDSGNPVTTTSGPVTLTVNAALALTTTSLPNGFVGTPYSATIGVTGGTSPYSCTFTAGTLPAGLTLTSAGCIVSGTPTTAGTSNLTVKATDSSNPALTVSGPISITISTAGTLSITSPPPATVGVVYSGPIGITGGTGPYTCVLVSGTLPAGLTLTGCTITGTPTTPGSTPITVKVTDSGNPTITTTGPITITVNPVPTLTLTGTAPNAIVNVPYTDALTAAGGITPYKYAVTTGTLPAGLSLNTTTGVISGTPTTVGASSFTVTVTDTESPTPQTATLALVLLVTYPVTPNDPELKGPYAYLFQGYDDAVAGVLAYQTATVGSFTASGTGVISAGELDANHQTSTATGNTISSNKFLGTYTVGTDSRGFITLTTLNANGTTATTATYAISLKVPTGTATVSTQGSLIEYDSNQLAGTKGSGSLLAQTASAISTGLTGSYAFGLQGDTTCPVSCTVGILGGPSASVGEFTANASGSTIAGTGDANISATTYPSSTLAGSYGAADTNGRVQLSMLTANVPTNYPTDYAVYLVDGNSAFIMSTDKHSTFTLLAGSAQARTQTTFSNASLENAFIGYENAATNPGLVSGLVLQNVLNFSTATIFRTTATADGNCNVTSVDVGGLSALTSGLTGILGGLLGLDTILGTYSTTGAITCAVSTIGRGTLQYPQEYGLLGILIGTPPPPRIVYLSAPDKGYFLESSYAGIGNIEAQTGSPYSAASFDGTYVYGGTAASSVASINSSGTITANGAGTETSTVDENIGVGTINVLELGEAGTGTYTTPNATTGRFTLNTTDVIYVISPGRLVMVDTSALTTSPTITLLY